MFLSNIYSLCGSHLDVYLTFIVIDDSFSYGGIKEPLFCSYRKIYIDVSDLDSFA